MPSYICVTCGTQFRLTDKTPDRCPICEDERQYVNWEGQKWTTLEELRSDHSNIIKPEGSGLIGIGTKSSFAIGQRALLVQNPTGNILWDCISLIDDATIVGVNELGGVSAIAVSHPHYYSSMVEWSDAFGNVPIYLHAADREWVMRPDPAIVFWEGETHSLSEELILIRCGGHFPGGTVLHRSEGAGGRGVLLSGDIIQVVPDRRHVSFMYSYPNYIPLSSSAVYRILESVEPFEFEAIYGAWWGLNILSDAKEAVARSARRYARTIENET